ncbi:fluoride efflux transporter CrcB [Streptomyces gardneri]|uniref:fluoride efflux transporter CrcB n=1 Tax=Nocardia TaxID=1817 RepID=UPI001357FA3E|nr:MULTISPECIES: fluoride efflux transporter CrcB [Nocardia]MBF6168053.1 fluoride efflux transporter CrcB [Streptomyces gardneri]MBF6206832.1 fluoride efflux transporter CrcB [Streptomyces gardneri]
MNVLLVLVGGAIGAPLRYLIDRAVQDRRDSLFPWGTFLVNLLGCLVLGALAGAGTALPSSLFVLLGTGFCGALTTYSTFGYETVRLADRGAYLFAAVNVVASVSAGLIATVSTYAAVHALLG